MNKRASKLIRKFANNNRSHYRQIKKAYKLFNWRDKTKILKFYKSVT